MTDQPEPDGSFIEQWPADPFPPPGRALVQVLCVSTVIVVLLPPARFGLRLLTGYVPTSMLPIGFLVSLLAALLWFSLATGFWRPWRWVGRARLDGIDPGLRGELVEVVLLPPLAEGPRWRRWWQGRRQRKVYAGMLAIDEGWVSFDSDGCRFALHWSDIQSIPKEGPLSRSARIASVSLSHPIDGTVSITLEAHRASTPISLWAARTVLFADLQPIVDAIRTAQDPEHEVCLADVWESGWRGKGDDRHD